MAGPNKRRLAATLLKSAAALVIENSPDSDHQAVSLTESALATVKGLGSNGAVTELPKK